MKHNANNTITKDKTDNTKYKKILITKCINGSKTRSEYPAG
jgi:predicted restriction endonuclease